MLENRRYQKNFILKTKMKYIQMKVQISSQW